MKKITPKVFAENIRKEVGFLNHDSDILATVTTALKEVESNVAEFFESLTVQSDYCDPDRLVLMTTEGLEVAIEIRISESLKYFSENCIFELDDADTAKIERSLVRIEKQIAAIRKRLL